MTDRQAIMEECDRIWNVLNGWARDDGLTKAERYAVADAMLTVTDLQSRIRASKGQARDDGHL